MFGLFAAALFNVTAATGDDLRQAAAERTAGTPHAGLI
jgi:hypothetical protein